MRAALAEPPARMLVRHELRYRGQSFELTVEEEIEPGSAGDGLDPDALRARFAHAHERRYGYRDEHAEVELVNIRVSVWGASPPLLPRSAATPAAPAPELKTVIFDGRPTATKILRGELAPGSTLSGPALCVLPEATLLIPPGWMGEIDAHGTAHLRDAAATTDARR
jgi:N-methylhydantoinase A